MSFRRNHPRALIVPYFNARMLFAGIILLPSFAYSNEVAFSKLESKNDWLEIDNLPPKEQDELCRLCSESAETRCDQGYKGMFRTVWCDLSV